MSNDRESSGVSGDGRDDETAQPTPIFCPLGWTARPAVADEQEPQISAPEPVDEDAHVAQPLALEVHRETGPAARRQRYRERHVRYDYIPSDEANEIIGHALEANPHLGASRVIDNLVLAGAQHFIHCTADTQGASDVEVPTAPGRA